MPKALLIIADEVRSDAHETLKFFKSQGVEIKIISGDHPRTLKAVAEHAGLQIDHVVDMSRYAEDADYGELAQQNQVFARVSPFQKRQLLKDLQGQGHIVAMTGDGVNDAWP